MSPTPGAQSLRSPWLPCLGSALLLAGLLGCQQQAPEPSAPQAEPAGPPFFQEVTDTSGIDATFRNGEGADHYAILESLGGGAAVFDFDGDGLLDVFVPGGGRYDRTDAEYRKDPTRPPRILGLPGKLYRNLGGWKFRDVTGEVMPRQALC